MDVDNIRLPCTSAEFDRTGESAWEEEWHRAICMPSRFSFQFDFMLCKPKYCLFIAHTGWWGEERRGITLPYPPHSVSRTVQYFLSSPDFSSPKWEKNIHLKSEYIMISVQTDADCYGAESCVLNTCMCSMWTSREQHAVAAYGSYMYVHQIHVITSQFSLDTILVM